MGQPGFLIPLIEGGAHTFPGAGAWGNRVSPPCNLSGSARLKGPRRACQAPAGVL